MSTEAIIVLSIVGVVVLVFLVSAIDMILGHLSFIGREWNTFRSQSHQRKLEKADRELELLRKQREIKRLQAIQQKDIDNQIDKMAKELNLPMWEDS